ncbi:T9SS type A sorting domain-containing protein [Aureisphaera galaxeae]|uniref:T9SS type A sorting domain-containing protein n=1 Tax=Aureisphaera galaxeae TaxID=1538023 RepID=UPI00234FDACD|nr:T9SS type A sorting domain-containing protein [Aureisphaera galaxeae]MDC8002592.1 T9SS type A sorting domain-containing protein [Aureisphaera galaxeae]
MMKTSKLHLKLVSLFLFFISVSHITNAQQYDTWAFGEGAGFNIFDFTAPIPSDINMLEATASYCDGAGNLLFYTDGTNIYNPIAGDCLGCLNGNPNGTLAYQGVVIVPKPGGAVDEFYIFTVSDTGIINHGLSYYEYNATTGALSGITTMGISAGTNGGYCQERVTAVPNCDGTGYWVVVKPIILPSGTFALPSPVNPGTGTNSSLYAYEVTAAGVSNTPVISDAGYASTTGFNMKGQAKFSPNKDYFAISEHVSPIQGRVHLFRFNAATGVFHKLQVMPYQSSQTCLGASFSPNSNLLYASGGGMFLGQASVRQYDLSTIPANPTAAPANCDFNVPNIPTISNPNTSLQLTTNGEIISSRDGSYEIDVIYTPNSVGCAAMNYTEGDVTVGTPGGALSRWGLPNNIDGTIESIEPTLQAFERDCLTYRFWLSGCDDTIQWDFGDGEIITGSPDDSVSTGTTSGTLLFPEHIFPGNGTYNVSVTFGGTTLNTVIEIMGETPEIEAVGFPICDGTTTATINVTNSALFPGGITWTDCSDPSNPYTLPTESGTSYTIDPSVVPDGIYTLCIEGIDDAGCIGSATYTFSTDQGEWPKTSNDTDSWDQGNATDMDQHHDIYMAGEFDDYVEFDDFPVVGSTLASRNAYLTKYDDCEGLEWVARTISNQMVSRTSMSVNRGNNRVYVTGRCEGSTQFFSGDGPDGPSPGGSITKNGNGIYIAIYKYNGQLVHVEMIYDTPVFRHKSSHIAASPTNAPVEHNVYVAINEEVLVPGNDTRIRVVAFSHVSGPTLNFKWSTPLESSRWETQIQDISAYKRTVAITGYFRRDLFYFNPTMTALGANTGNQEAYVATMEDNGTFPSYDLDLTKPMVNSFNNVMNSVGRGVQLANSNTLYLIGNYTNAVNEPFGIAGVLPHDPNPNVFANYAVRLGTIASQNWHRSIWSKSNMYAGDVAYPYTSGEVYFTGNFKGENFFIQNDNLASFSSIQRSYVLSMSTNGDYLSPESWQNFSTTTSGNEYIYPIRMTANHENVYVTGVYKGTQSMINDIATNSPLTSTPGAINNSFLWRFDANVGGISKLSGTTPEEEKGKSVLDKVTIYPNPSDHMVHIRSLKTEDENMEVSVFDTTGKLIHNQSADARGMDIDVTAWKSGIYFVQIRVNGEKFMEKLVRE